MTFTIPGASLRCALSMALAVASITGCSKPQDAQTLMSEAAQYDRTGNLQAAIIQLKNALLKDPKSVEARRRLAMLYIKRGDGLSAEKEIRKAMEGHLPPEQAWPTLAKSFLLQAQYQKILDEAPKGVENDARSITLRGDAYVALGKNAEAENAYERALKSDATLPDAFIGRARLHAAQRDLAAAHADLEKALAIDNRNANAWLFKGYLLKAENKPEEALAAFSHTLQVDPNSADAYLAKAYLEIGMGKFADAQQDINAAGKTGTASLVIFHCQALLHYLQGKPKQALDAVQQVLRAATDHPPSLLLAGVIQKDLGAMRQAEHYLGRYLEMDPTNLYALKQFASVLLGNGDEQRASQLLETALKATPNDAQLIALAGQASLQRKDYVRAAAEFEKAALIAPASATIQTALGVTNLAQGNSSAAVSALEKAARLDKKSLDAGILLVNARIAAKKYDAALAAVRQLAEDHPENPAILNLAGLVYLRMDDAKSAKASFEKALSLEPAFFPAAASLAKMDIKENRPEAAQQRFLAVLEKDKANAPAMVTLAELAAAQRKPAEAIEWLEKASKTNPNDARLAALLARQYLAAGHGEKAKASAKAFALKNPESPAALETLAQTQFALKDKSAALDTLSQLPKTGTDTAASQLRVALMHIEQGDYRAAQEAVNQALAAKPDYAEARFLDGMLKTRQGKTQDAYAIARALQKDIPGSARGYLLEGEAWMVRKEPAAAVRSFDTAFRLEPSALALIKLYRSLEQAGRSVEANERAVRWLNDHPRDMQVRMLAAESNLAHGRYKNAIMHYEILAQQAPNNVAVLNNLAFAYQASDDKRAVATAEKAYSLAADNPAVLDTLGWILVQRGDHAKGLPMLRQAMTLAPGSKDIRQHLEQAERGPSGLKALEESPTQKPA